MGNGVLRFTYAWGSSTGELAHLVQCQIGEIVTYPGGNPYYPPSPPFSNAGRSNPTIISFTAETGLFADSHSALGGFVTPYSAASYTATQNYRYSCPCENGGQWVNLAGPIQIVRTVESVRGSQWKYTITKSGASAAIYPLP